MENNSTTVGELFIQHCCQLLHEYDEFWKEFVSGSIGKAAQFRMKYLNQIRMQMLALATVQENDLDMLIC